MAYSRSNTNFEFTEDMAETLKEHFADFAEDGVVRIEKDEIGLWLVSSHRRAFLGLARLPERPQGKLQ